MVNFIVAPWEVVAVDTRIVGVVFCVAGVTSASVEVIGSVVVDGSKQKIYIVKTVIVEW